MSVGMYGGPSTDDVAETIGADPERLETFVENHPEPTAAIVLGAFGANPEHTQLVAEWLLARENQAEPSGEENVPGGESA